MRYRSGSSIACTYKYKWRTDGLTSWKDGEYSILNTWEMVDETHPNFGGNYAGPGDNGGPFDLSKRTTYFGSVVYPFHKNGLVYPSGIYTGPLLAGGINSFPQSNDPVKPSTATIVADGATAIARVNPSTPDFSLATQFGEAREKFPHIIGSSVMRDKVNYLRTAGDEYLNVEFGWKPLVGSVLGFARTVKSSNATINSFRRYSQHHTRRRFSYPDSTVIRTVVNAGGSCSPTHANQTAVGSGYETITKQKWFAGAFLYFLPVSDTYAGKMLQWEHNANKLLGTRLTPSVLWELAPWSWAVDWFSNTGDVMTNLSNFGPDASVMKYGYMMNKHDKYFHIAQFPVNNGKTYTVSKTHHYGMRTRMASTPYGFGLDPALFTPRQVAIVTALGLSRS